MSAARLVVATSALFFFCSFANATTSSGLDGSTVNAQMEPISGTCAILNQWATPQVVINPGVEFTNGAFTPNAAGYPIDIENTNSMGLEADLFGDTIRIIQHSGSIQGFHSNFGPVLRATFTDLQIPGQMIVGITQTAGTPPYAVTLTSPHSVAIDFDDMSERTQDFQLITQIPEATTLLLLLPALIPLLTRRFR